MNPSDNIRNLLVIAYLFPPLGGIGAQRPFKFTKYLKQHGWKPTVLTVDNGYSVTKDAHLLDELEDDIAIYRAKDPTSLVQRTLRRSHSETPGASNIAGVRTPSPSMKQRLIRRLKPLKEWLMVPDEQMLWVLAAARMARRIIKEQNIQAIYTTSGPHSTHLVGYLLKRWTGLPWIADFRDPWTQNMHYKPLLLRSRIEAGMERNVMRQADIVLTVTDSFAKLFTTKYPYIHDKLTVIPNGFDSKEFGIIEPQRQDDRFTIFYGGILYEKRSPRYFLEALKLAIDRGDLPHKKIVVRFAGVFDYPGRSENHDLVVQLGLTDVIQVEGYLSHTETIARMKGADLLLLIGDLDEQAGQYIPGKLFEYMGAGRSILSLTVPGEASTIVKKYSLGRVVSPTHPEEIADALAECYHERSQQTDPDQQNPMDGDIRQFDRAYQTEQLAKLLNTLVHDYENNQAYRSSNKQRCDQLTIQTDN